MKNTKKIVRNFLYKGRRVRVADCSYSNGDGAYHVWIGRKRISCFGFGSIEECVEEAKFTINSEKRDKV